MNQPSVEPPSDEGFEAPEPEAKLDAQDLRTPYIDEPVGGTDAGSTIKELLRYAPMLIGCPDEDHQVYFRDLESKYSKPQTTWILQQWLRGELEAYDPYRRTRILPPRGYRGLPVSWGYISSFIHDFDPNFHVDVVTPPPNLGLYGNFLPLPDDFLTFELSPDDRPELKRIETGHAKVLPIALILKKYRSEEKIWTSLALNIERDATVGLVAWASYGRLRFHGFSREILDFARNCFRERVFLQNTLTPRDEALWIITIARFFSRILTNRLPASLAQIAEVGAPENQVIDQAQEAVDQRLHTMVFDKNMVEASLARFRARSAVISDTPLPAVAQEGADNKQKTVKKGRNRRGPYFADLCKLLQIPPVLRKIGDPHMPQRQKVEEVRRQWPIRGYTTKLPDKTDHESTLRNAITAALEKVKNSPR